MEGCPNGYASVVIVGPGVGERVLINEGIAVFEVEIRGPFLGHGESRTRPAMTRDDKEDLPEKRRKEKEGKEGRWTGCRLVLLSDKTVSLTKPITWNFPSYIPRARCRKKTVGESNSHTGEIILSAPKYTCVH